MFVRFGADLIASLRKLYSLFSVEKTLRSVILGSNENTTLLIWSWLICVRSLRLKLVPWIFIWVVVPSTPLFKFLYSNSILELSNLWSNFDSFRLVLSAFEAILLAKSLQNSRSYFSLLLFSSSTTIPSYKQSNISLYCSSSLILHSLLTKKISMFQWT